MGGKERTGYTPSTFINDDMMIVFVACNNTTVFLSSGYDTKEFFWLEEKELELDGLLDTE